jgi:UrcA family protein
MNTQIHVCRRLTAIVLTLILADPVAGLEPGQGFDAGRSETVDGSDLDVSRRADAEVLYARIRSAAHSVCRAEKAAWDGKAVSHQRRCVAEAVETAVARANEPLLTAIHRANGERVAER